MPLCDSYSDEENGLGAFGLFLALGDYVRRRTCAARAELRVRRHLDPAERARALDRLGYVAFLQSLFELLAGLADGARQLRKPRGAEQEQQGDDDQHYLHGTDAGHSYAFLLPEGRNDLRPHQLDVLQVAQLERKGTQRDDHFFDAKSRHLPQPIHDFGNGAGNPGGAELL